MPSIVPLDPSIRRRLAPRSIAERVRSRWLAVLVVLATLVQATGLLRVLPGRQPPPMKDSVIFEVYGWYLLRGRRLYVDLWELKPPLNYQTTAVLAFLSGGNPLVYHYMNVGLTAGAAVGSAALVGMLVVEVTDRRLAGVVGGLAAFAHPVIFMRAAYGFKAKYFVVFAGLLAVYLVLRERPFAAGVAAAAAVGYWQMGLVFPLVVVGLAAQRGDRETVGYVAAGGLAMAALTLGPVILRGGLVAMLGQVVISPLTVGGSFKLPRRFGWLLNLLGAGGLGVALGMVGVASTLAGPDLRRHWWAPAIWGWFAGHLVYLNLDFYGDLIPIVLVSGLGVGLLVGRLPEWSVEVGIVSALVAAIVLVNVVTLGAVAGMDRHPTAETKPVARAGQVDPPYLTHERRALLYAGVEPTTCHVFISKRQRAWVQLTGGEGDADVCGRLPPDYRWIRDVVPDVMEGPIGKSRRGTAPGPTGTPTATATPTPTTPTHVVNTFTPSPEPDGILVESFDWTRDEGTMAVTVSLRNHAEQSERTATVVVSVTVGNETLTERRQVTLGPGEETEFTVEFDVGDGMLRSIEIEVED